VGYQPISNYGVIGDMHSAALVSLDGSIDWLCFPRFDSPSVFAAILDERIGGRFRIRPTGQFTATQAYRTATNILETEFATATGSATLVDFMPMESDADACLHQVVRILRCESGRMDFELEFTPRLNYARSPTSLFVDGRSAVARNGEDALKLLSDVPLHAEGDGARAKFQLSSGQRVSFVLDWEADIAEDIRSYDVASRLDETERFWRSVADEITYDGLWRKLVRRSMLALHLLIYLPSGAVCAAATTSLPEDIGGVRNWDYRFTWPRDAAFTFDILHRLGHTTYTRPFLDWLVPHAGAEGHDLHSLYSIETNADPHGMTERILEHLEGYRGSRPVRIGNAAYHQFQLDVFGEIMLSLASYERAGGEFDESLWQMALAMVEGAARCWQQPDLGIWEFRTEPRHFTYSKLMCWVALDRGLRLANRLQKPVDFQRWRNCRDAIRQQILAEGWNPERGSFTQYLNGHSLDASLAFIPMVGFLPGNDPRVHSTVEAIWRELGDGGLIRRYIPEEADDGIHGDEGTFTMCSLWLAGALVTAGRLDEAEAIFTRVVEMSNHVGLYSEMLDPASGEYLGNYPQAFTHIALIHTARNLDHAFAKRRAVGLA
jgi:GH15 family glucan-1,4-alpha-glucosidase